MFCNNRIFIALCLFLVVVLSTSTPATAQVPEKPLVIFIPEETSAGIRIYAIATGECTGRLVVSITGIPGATDLDLSNMRFGESRRFETGKYLYQGYHVLGFNVRESLVGGDCNFSTRAPFYPIRFIVGNRHFGNKDPHVPILNDGKRAALVFDESDISNPKLRFGILLPGPGLTEIYVVQPFPNGTATLEYTASIPTPEGFEYHTTYVPRGRMTEKMPIYFWMVSPTGIATAGFIHRP